MIGKSIDGISMQTLKRLPLYLHFLEDESKKGIEYISTPTIANQLGLTEILVKKDLMCVVKISGKPKIGHKVSNLISDLKEFLGYDDVSKAVLVGAGSLGRALLGYKGFGKWNIEIIVAFDNNPLVIGEEVNGIKILSIDKMEELCKRMNIHIGIITTNDDAAQEVCDELIRGGVKGIWNFAPKYLKVPDGVIVQNENLASSLAVLSKKLSSVIK